MLRVTRPAVLTALVFCAAAGMFLVAVGYPFISFDDPTYVTENPHVLGGLTLANLGWAFGPGIGAWWPLTWVSLQLDATLFGGGPAGFHLVNILLHAATAALVFRLVLTVVGPARDWLALVAAILFAWHPLRVESVAWITERKDVLSGCFSALACLVYVRTLTAPGLAGRALTVVLLVMAVLAKPMALTLPAAFFLLRLAAPRATPPARGWLADLGPAAAAVVALAALQAAIVAGHDTVALNGPWLDSVADVPRRACVYFAKSVAPLGLTIISFRHPVSAFSVAWSVVTLALLAGALTRFRGQLRELAWGAAWFLLALTPVIGVVPIGFHDVADRFTYWPHVGLVPAGVLFLHRVLPARWRTLAAVAALVLCGSATLARLSLWSDPMLLYTNDLEQNPDNPILRMARARLALSRGDWQTAADDFTVADRVLGPSVTRDAEWAIALVELGRWPEAEARFGRAESAGDRRATLNHARALAKHGRYSEAADLLRRLPTSEQTAEANALLQSLRHEGADR